jgi:hypothetical protein
MVTFRCKRSGNTVSFTNPDDIKSMRIHESYTEVLDERPRTERVPEKEEARKEVKVLKKRGRPKTKNSL